MNPETKRINRDIIRSHNEVMLVIGVAEQEQPNAGPELESQAQHDAYEENIGVMIAGIAGRCVETIGVFGVHGLRQRILVRLGVEPPLTSIVLTFADLQTLLGNSFLEAISGGEEGFLLFSRPSSRRSF